MGLSSINLGILKDLKNIMTSKNVQYKLFDLKKEIPSKYFNRLVSLDDKYKKKLKINLGFRIFFISITLGVFTPASILLLFLGQFSAFLTILITTVIGFGINGFLRNNLRKKYEKINLELGNISNFDFYSENENSDLLNLTLVLEDSLDEKTKKDYDYFIRDLNEEEVLNITDENLRKFAKNKQSFKRLKIAHLANIFHMTILKLNNPEYKVIFQKFIDKYSYLFNLMLNQSGKDEEISLISKLDGDDFFEAYTKSISVNFLEDIKKVFKLETLEKELEEKQVLELFEQEFRASSTEEKVNEEIRLKERL